MRQQPETRQSLEELNKLLEQRVAERTAELAAAKEAAEAASRAKSLFLADASHELRTPLNAVLGFSQLMARDEHLSPEHRRYLETISRSGRHLLSLLNDILEISRIEGGRVQITPETFAPADLVRSLATTLQADAAAKGLALRQEISETLPAWIRTDAVKLRQILANLLGNAVKFTTRGEVALEVSATAGAEGLRLECTVKDTGIGMSAGELGHIFEPFFIGGPGVRREGTGLGLPITARYIDALGGHISVESTPGGGTVFRFDIPVESVAAPQPTGPAGDRAAAATAAATEVRILVVDDDEDQRMLTTRLLRNSALALREAASGAEALQIFAAWQPHLILMDMRMPGMDGLEAARHIRALPGGDSVVIIALTASAFEEERATFIAAGCDEVAIKPVELEKVMTLLAKHLGIQPPTAPSDAAPATSVAPLAPQRLADLPLPLRRQLHDAAIRLDRDGVAAICAALDAEHPEAADAIRNLTDNYRYDELARLVEESPAS